MRSRSVVSSLLVIGLLAGRPAGVGAHRLDEYLQATRIAIDVGRVGVEIDLTPGVSIAPLIIRSIDADGDGRIDEAESKNYARQVLSDVALTVDGRRLPVTLDDARFPTGDDMMLGIGTIRVHGMAMLAGTASGPHQIGYVNAHGPEASVYLANALVPYDDRIRISGQRRDVAQRGLTIDYRFTSGTAGAQVWWLLAALAMTAGLITARRGGFRRMKWRSASALRSQA